MYSVMAMAGRCAVETLAEFGVWLTTPGTSKITVDSGTHAFICSGSEEVFIFNIQEKRLTGVLQFPTSVRDLAQTDDKQHLYVASRSAVYCINLQPVLSRLSANESSSPAELKMLSEDVVIREEGVLSVLPVGSVLVTLSLRDISWIFTVYKTAEQSDCYEMLSSISLPVVSLGEKVNKAMGICPVMICIHLRDAEISSSDRHVNLDATLFKLLFGLDAALIKSPVILCGLPDGRLISLPLRFPGIHVLHSLEEPVVFVGASVVKETNSGHAFCLVAVGEYGRVVVIKTCKGGTEEQGRRVMFSERCVAGPVMSACVDRTCMYLSTGSDLLSINMSEEASGKDEQECNEEVTNKSQQSFNVCRVITFGRPTTNVSGEVELLGLSEKGKLQRITLPVAKEVTGSSTHQHTQVGRSVKDLLSAIGDVCERASALKTTIKSKNQILQHLNQVLNVSFLLIDSTEGVDRPIICNATTTWSRLLQKDSLHLTCTLQNSSPYSLEQGWALCITVFPLSDHSQEQTSSTNYSFPFCNLHPGQKFEVTLPLTTADDTPFPINVSCVLVYSLRTLLDEEQIASISKVQSSTISLPLNTLTVDWLHALKLNTSDKNVTKMSTSTDTLHAFLESRKSSAKSNKIESKPYSVSIRVSSDLLKDTVTLKSLDAETKSSNICVTLLDWLFCEPHKGVRGHQWDSGAPNSAILQAQSPNGHLVKLSAKEVNVGVEEESLAVVELQVESVSLAAVCGLHHAFLDRIQTLVQKPLKKSSPLRIQNLGLRAALQRAELLLQQIQQSRLSGALSVGVSSGQVTRSLLKVYQELRQHPLVIF